MPRLRPRACPSSRNALEVGPYLFFSLSSFLLSFFIVSLFFLFFPLVLSLFDLVGPGQIWVGILNF